MALHFLGWDRPVVELAAEFLFQAVSGRPLDLSRVMVVVPTRQAGRALRERLATVAQRRGTMVLTPLLAQPSHVVHPRGQTATPAECLAVLAHELSTLDDTQSRALFPAKLTGAALDFSWRLDAAETLLELRHSLAEGGFTLATAAARLSADPGFPEPERWQCLASLEARFADALARHGLRDPVQAQLDAARDPALPEGIDSVAIIGVPDPMPLAVTAWERLVQRSCRIEVCVHAPVELASLFDEWGRPRRTAWHDRLPRVHERAIHLAPKPQDQADLAVRLLPENLDPAQAPGLLALGVLDDEVLPHMETAMTAAGIPVFNPALRPVSNHALYHLVRDLLRLVTEDGFEEFASLIRNPLAIRYFIEPMPASDRAGVPHDPGRGAEPESAVSTAHVGYGIRHAERLLHAADDLQNRHLPGSFAAFRERALAHGPQAGHAVDHGLARVCAVIAEWLTSLRGPDWVAGLRVILPVVLDPASGGKVSAPDPLPRIADAMQELFAALASPALQAVLPDTGAAARELFLRLLARVSLDPEHPGRRVDLDGWLELHWNDAPLLILAGFNEGRVPATIVGHAFLPDRARGILGLADNESRRARDSYLFAALLACRPQPDSVQIAVGKTTAAGDVLRPSPLLFGSADDTDLARRAEYLFGPVEAVAPAAAAGTASAPFLRVPWVPPRQRLSVTALTSYLNCPFRFYLQQVLGMAEQDDRKRELDALDYGTVAHEVLARFASAAAQRDSTDPKAIASFLTGELQDVFRERFGRNLSAALLLQRSSLEQRLCYAAAEQARSRQAHWRIVELDGRWAEHAMEMDIGGTVIQARIDRIDRNEETGQFRVLDYKTSNVSEAPARTHLVNARDDMPAWRRLTGPHAGKAWANLQLPLYSLMLRERLDAADVAGAYFNLPKAVLETRILAFAELDAGLLDAARVCAGGIVAAVRAGVFWPPAERPDSRRERDAFNRLRAGDWAHAFDLAEWPARRDEVHT